MCPPDDDVSSSFAPAAGDSDHDPVIDEDAGDESEEVPDDGGQGADPEPESEAEEGEEAGEGEPKADRPTLEQLEARVREKEAQTYGLTQALHRERRMVRMAKDRFYSLVAKLAENGVDLAQRGADAAGEPATEEEIDPNDPVAEIKHGLKKVNEKLSAQELREQERESEQLTTRALDWVGNDARAAMEQEPSYPDAANFVAQAARQAILGRLMLENPGADEFELHELAEHKFLHDTARLQVLHMQRGRSYAQAVLAAARQMGWRPGATSRDEGAQLPARAGHSRRSPLDSDRSARAGMASLSQVPSAQGRKTPRETDLLKMDDDEFAELLESDKVNFKKLAAALATR